MRTPQDNNHIMRNVSRNLLISIAYIAVLMFGLLTQSAQAYAESDNVKTIRTATGNMPCHESVDGYSVKGSKCLFADQTGRSEEHTSELQSLMRISYAVFSLKKKKT